MPEAQRLVERDSYAGESAVEIGSIATGPSVTPPGVMLAGKRIVIATGPTDLSTPQRSRRTDDLLGAVDDIFVVLGR